MEPVRGLCRVYLGQAGQSVRFFLGGFPTIALGIFVPAGAVNATNYNVNKILNSFWVGGKYNIWSNLSANIGFYYQEHNDYLPAGGLHGLQHRHHQRQVRRQQVSHLRPDQLQAVQTRRHLRRRDGLERVRRLRERVLQVPGHRPGRRHTHPLLTARLEAQSPA